MRAARVSRQALTILEVLARFEPGHQLRLRAVRMLAFRRDVTYGVARASLSRTLRRLWHAGLVELYDGSWRSLTAEYQRALAHANQVAADPDAAYAHFCQFFSCAHVNRWYDGVAAYVAAMQEKARRGPQGFHVQGVSLTDAGRQRLTPLIGPELTDTRAGIGLGVSDTCPNIVRTCPADTPRTVGQTTGVFRPPCPVSGVQSGQQDRQTC